MPEIIKDREKKAYYLTASSTERALYIALWFIISKVLLYKFMRGQNGCREHGNNNSMDTACSCLYRMEQHLQGDQSMGFQQACEHQKDKYAVNSSHGCSWPKYFSAVDLCVYGLYKQSVKAKRQWVVTQKSRPFWICKEAFILRETCGPVWGTGDSKLKVGESQLSARAFDESKFWRQC